MISYLVILALVIVADVVGRWAFLPARYLPRSRARALRVRLFLRLHPGKGFATVFGLWLRWGRLAALRRLRRIRPSLPWWVRALAPGEHSVFLGRAHWRHGCEDPATAIRRADAFAFAVSREGMEDGSFWSAKASDYLRSYFHAAALAGYGMSAVAAWVSGADPHVPERILTRAGAYHWALTLAELRSEAQKTTATVRMVMSRAVVHG